MGRRERAKRTTVHAGNSLMARRVTFAYEGATSNLFEELTLHCDGGWTGVVGANGVGKSTLLLLAAGILEPLAGSLRRPDSSLYCAQRTDEAPVGLEEFLASHNREAVILKQQLALETNWLTRWSTLSHGERKRAQMAVALFRAPSLLAVDEPTNHIDAAGRRLIAEALAAYQGVGLLVSHDRELLDRLCHQCVFIEPPNVTVRHGSYSTARTHQEADEEATRRSRAVAEAEVKRLNREELRWREDVSRSKRRHSKRSLARGDHDGREKINRARLTGRDAVGGRRLRQTQGRLARAQRRCGEIPFQKRYELGIRFVGGLCKRSTLFRLEATTLPIGERTLELPDLLLTPGERVACTGPNGTGKSTLIRHILTNLTLPSHRVTYVPQEIDRKEGRQLLETVRSLPREARGDVLSIVSRLGSRPTRLIESREPSPGEIRKLLLGLGLAREPYLIVMDEPTNHLDLPSVLCLEEALAACRCGLLLVSHDPRFVGRLCEKRWLFEPTNGNARVEVGWCQNPDGRPTPGS